MELRALDPTSVLEVDAALALFKTVYKREMTKEFYTWRFLANPFGPPMVSLLWDGATLAGHYAVCPMRSLVGDKVVASAQSMTTMTHPSYRNQGVFSKLAEHLYSTMADLGVGMVWGFPNTQSHYGFIHRLGWRDIAVIVTMTRGTEDVPEGAPALRTLGDVRGRISELFERSIDGRIYPSYRDSQYFRWRYQDCPGSSYTILSYGEPSDAVAVVKSYELGNSKALEVVEILHGGSPDLAGPLFAGLLAYAAETGHRLLRTWLSLADPAFAALEKLHFAPKEPIVYFGGRDFRSRILRPEDFRSDRWAVSMGDSDNY